MSNLISASLSAEDQRIILDCIATIKSKLPFGLKLSKEERQALPKMSDGRVPFVQKGIRYGGQQPLIVPPYTDLNECDRDLDLYIVTGPVESGLQSLTELVVDTRIAAGADAYTAALSIYKSAQGAVKAGVPGSQSIVDDLKKLFDGQGNFKKETENK